MIKPLMTSKPKLVIFTITLNFSPKSASTYNINRKLSLFNRLNYHASIVFFYLSLRKTKEAGSRRGSTTIAYNDFMNLKFRKTQNITNANSKLSQGEQGINKFIIVSKRRMAGLLSSSSAWSARNGSTRTPGPAVLSGKLQCRRLSRSD